MRRGSSILQMADVIALVTKKPRTIRELSELAGISRYPVRRYLDALHGEGLVAFESQSFPGVGKVNVFRWVA